MTRINLIPPFMLHRKFLQAEYYELPEIFSLVRARQAIGHGPANCNIPDTYRFGTGHKIFFYNKLSWVTHRYHDLVDEMRKRGYNVNEMIITEVYRDLALHWWGDWDPPQEAIDLSRQRIQQRIIDLGLYGEANGVDE